MSKKLDAILCNHHALALNARVGFIQHTSDKSFLVNNFADLPDVQVQTLRFHPVIGAILF